MIEPQKCLSRIRSNDDDYMDALYDLLIYVRAAKGIRANAELDEFMLSVFAHTSTSRQHQHQYDKRRLTGTSRRAIQANSTFPA